MEKICLYCNSKYSTNHSNSLYCSIKCGQKDRKNRKNDYLKTDKIIRDWSKKLRAYDYFGNKCEKCGDTNIFHFVFHHKNPETKEYQLCDIWQSSWSKILKELEKCSLLCENCHKELHHNDVIKDNRFRITKSLFINYKGNKCEKCGYNKCDSALVFHHESEKEFSIGDNKKRIKTLNDLTIELQNELDKTTILCANCHRDEHSVDLTKFWDKIIERKSTYKESKKQIDVEKVIKYNSENKTSIEISKILNCSSSAIRNILKRLRENETNIQIPTD